MRATCVRCGTGFEARRASARYCGSSCRSLAAQERRRAGVVTELAARPPAEVPSLVDAVRAELEEAGRLTSVPGVAALNLAARIEAQSETGAAVATLTRQLHATMGEALKGARRDDLVDELRARRERRGA